MQLMAFASLSSAFTGCPVALPALVDEEEEAARKAREAEKRKAKKERLKAKKSAAKVAEQPGAPTAVWP